MLRVVVLGAAAGGGVPQWNCGCPVCRAARSEHPELQEHASLDRGQRRRRALVPDQRLSRSAPATDRDAAASSQGRKASPQPDRGRDPDQWRDRCGRGPVVDARGLAVHDLRACARCLRSSKSNSIFNVLNEKNVRRQPIEVDQAFEPALPDGSPSGIEILPFAVPGKGAWYLEGKAHPAGSDGAGDTLGLRIADKATRQIFLFPRRLRRCHRRPQVPACRRAAGLLRRHGVARRRIDRGRASATRPDKAWDISPCRAITARSKPCRPRYRPEGVSAYQQFQPGAAARFRRAQDGRARGLANPRRWNGDHAVNAMTN